MKKNLFRITFENFGCAFMNITSFLEPNDQSQSKICVLLNRNLPHGSNAIWIIALNGKKLWFLHNFSKHLFFSQKCIANGLLLIQYQNVVNMTSCHNILCPGCSKTRIRGPNNFSFSQGIWTTYYPQTTYRKLLSAHFGTCEQRFNNTLKSRSIKI